MPKLGNNFWFLDISDYFRLPARLIAHIFKYTPLRAIFFTWLFLICGLLSVYFFLNNQIITGSIFFALKILFDTVDGEIARLTKEPRYTGRYFDSIADYILNILYIGLLYNLNAFSIQIYLFCFFSMILHCSIYNYYTVVKRSFTNGDTTSRKLEFNCPTAFPYENQQLVKVLHKLFIIFYGIHDWIIYKIDPNVKGDQLPAWFLTLLSMFGLGIQLAIILVALLLNNPLIAIIYFCIFSNLLALALIFIRKTILKN